MPSSTCTSGTTRPLGCDFAAVLDSPVQWVFEKSPGYLAAASARPTARLPPRRGARGARPERAPRRSCRRAGRHAPARRGDARSRGDVHSRAGQRRPGPTDVAPDLVIAGAWTDTGWPATIESAVRSGRLAARCLLAVAQALHRAVEWLLQAQSTEGWWSGELETNVTMTAEHILLLRFLGASTRRHPRRRDPPHPRHAARATARGRCITTAPATSAPPSRRTSRCACSASTRDAPSMRRALRFDPRSGRRHRSTRLHQDLARALRRLSVGRRAEHAAGAGPPPAWAPLNLYDFACWARGTIAPLLIVVSRTSGARARCQRRRDRRARDGTPDARRPRLAVRSCGSTACSSSTTGSRCSRARRRRARKLVEWITERQEADGGWGGIQPPWVYSLIALNLEGYCASTIR